MEAPLRLAAARDGNAADVDAENVKRQFKCPRRVPFNSPAGKDGKAAELAGTTATKTEGLALWLAGSGGSGSRVWWGIVGVGGAEGGEKRNVLLERDVGRKARQFSPVLLQRALTRLTHCCLCGRLLGDDRGLGGVLARLHGVCVGVVWACVLYVERENVQQQPFCNRRRGTERDPAVKKMYGCFCTARARALTWGRCIAFAQVERSSQEDTWIP